MSSSSRRFFLTGSLALAGCGFTPVYQQGGVADGLRGKIRVDAPSGQNSFNLLTQLEQRLGRPDNPEYGLSLSTEIEREGLAISGSNDIERFNLIGEIDYVLTRLGTDEIVLRDQVKTFTAYSASLQPVATLSAERDATRRLMFALADKIAADILTNAAAL